MSRKAAFTATDVARAVAGAIKGGLPAGSFTVEVGDGIIRLLPAAQPQAVASAPSPAREALAKWRRSA